jgi:hypothetical protein
MDNQDKYWSVYYFLQYYSLGDELSNTYKIIDNVVSNEYISNYISKYLNNNDPVISEEFSDKFFNLLAYHFYNKHNEIDNFVKEIFNNDETINTVTKYLQYIQL